MSLNNKMSLIVEQWFQCKNCKGQFIGDHHTEKCPYCDSQNIEKINFFINIYKK